MGKRGLPVGLFSGLACAVACGSAAQAVAPEGAVSKDDSRPVSKSDTGVSPRRAAADGLAAVSPPEPSRAHANRGIGTAHPLLLQSASPSQNWVHLCQARSDTDGDGVVGVTYTSDGELRGDTISHYLVEDAGAGVLIDSLLAADATGRYVVLQRGGRTYLRDTSEKTERDLTVLGVDARRDQSAFAPHRTLSFDRTGTRLAYLRRAGEQQWIVVRDLAAEKETVFNPGTADVWRLGFEPAGHYLNIQVVVRDTDGDRRVEWSSPIAQDPPACAGPVPTYPVSETSGDRSDTHLLRLSDGQWLNQPDFVTTVGTGIITRSPPGELWLLSSAGENLSVSDKACSGRIFHISEKHGAILFGCAATVGGRRKMFVRTQTTLHPLGVDLAPFEVDGRLPTDSDLIDLYPRNDAFLLDLQNLSLVPLPPGTKVLAAHERKALGVRNGDLLILTLDHTGTPARLVEKQLGLKRPPLAEVTWSGQFVSVGPVVVNLGTDAVIRIGAWTPLALSRAGAVLLPDTQSPAHAKRPGGELGDAGVLHGPLFWRTQ